MQVLLWLVIVVTRLNCFEFVYGLLMVCMQLFRFFELWVAHIVVAFGLCLFLRGCVWFSVCF